MDFHLYALSVITFIIFKVACVSSGAPEPETSLNEVPTDRSFFLPTDLDDVDKRPSLFRYGKRGSLFRFGKRGSIMRFGKRGSIMRFGKRAGDEGLYDDADLYNYEGEEFPLSDYLADKRSTILRFGKRPSAMRFDRMPNQNQPPHTPWRFGRMEDDEEV